MSDKTRSMYKGFLIVELTTGVTRAYRNPGYLSNEVTSYKAWSRVDIEQIIDDAGDEGEFTESQYQAVFESIPPEKAEDATMAVEWHNRPELQDIVRRTIDLHDMYKDKWERGLLTPADLTRTMFASWAEADVEIRRLG